MDEVFKPPGNDMRNAIFYNKMLEPFAMPQAGAYTRNGHCGYDMFTVKLDNDTEEFYKATAYLKMEKQ